MKRILLIFACLTLFITESTFGLSYWECNSKINNFLMDYEHYEEDYQEACQRMCGKVNLALLAGSVGLGFVVGKKCFYACPERDDYLVVVDSCTSYWQSVKREEDGAVWGVVGLIAIATGIASYLITSYPADAIVKKFPKLQQLVASKQTLEEVAYFREKRDQTLEGLKAFIKQNNVSREQIDRIRHGIFFRPLKIKILSDIAKDIG